MNGRVRVDVEEAATFIRRFLVRPAGSRPSVLEVGGGDGRLAAELSRGGADVVMIDVESRSVIEARSRGVTAIEADWLTLTERLVREAGVPEGPFEAVVMVRCLHHFADLPTAIDQASSFLEPQSQLIVDDFAFLEANPAMVQFTLRTAQELQAGGFLHPPPGSLLDRLLRSRDAEFTWRDWGEREHRIHPAPAMREALEARFTVLREERAPYLYRFFLPGLGADADAVGRTILSAERDRFGPDDWIGRRWVTGRNQP